MRQGQQNKQRARRGNGGGRKNSNSATRSYDSNGPDVKIRGTAAHIAEKYNSLARDALSAGDIVMAENYLQHAEHYNRILASIQAQNNEKRAAAMASRVATDEEGNVSEATSDLADTPQPSLEEPSAVNGADQEADEEGASSAGKPAKRRPRRTMRRPRPAEVKPAESEGASDNANADAKEEEPTLPAFLLS